MVNILKFKSDAAQKVFFWSDMHYNHDPKWEVPLWKMRGFDSAQKHNDGLIARWNNKISKNDTVFHLGDILFGQDGEKSLDILLGKLNFKSLYLLAGNHLSGFKQHFRKSLGVYNIDEYYRLPLLLADGVNQEVYLLPNYYEIYVNGKPIVLSHYPLRSWNGHAQGSWACVGHVHGSLKDIRVDILDKGKILDVGVESVSEPISFDELKVIMDKKSILNESHHHKDTQTPFS